MLTYPLPNLRIIIYFAAETAEPTLLLLRGDHAGGSRDRDRDHGPHSIKTLKRKVLSSIEQDRFVHFNALEASAVSASQVTISSKTGGPLRSLHDLARWGMGITTV